MIPAVPLYCPDRTDDQKFHVGSGFAYAGQNGRWLMTVAHIALGTARASQPT